MGGLNFAKCWASQCVWGGVFWFPAPHPVIPPGYSAGDGPCTCLLWHSSPSGRLGGIPIVPTGVRNVVQGTPPDDFGQGAEHMRGIPVRRSWLCNGKAHGRDITAGHNGR